MEGRGRIRVIVADDHAVVVRGIRSLIGREPDLELSGEAAGYRDLAALAKGTDADVLVVDLGMPDGDPAEDLARLAPARVVVFTASTDPIAARDAVRAGAAGYVLKSSEPGELIAAIRAVAAGRTYIDRRLLSAPAHAGLSERELETIRMVAAGRRNREIADALGVGVKSVETYRSRASRKLGADSAAELVREAIRLGIVDAR